MFFTADRPDEGCVLLAELPFSLSIALASRRLDPRPQYLPARQSPCRFWLCGAYSTHSVETKRALKTYRKMARITCSHDRPSLCRTFRLRCGRGGAVIAPSDFSKFYIAWVLSFPACYYLLTG